MDKWDEMMAMNCHGQFMTCSYLESYVEEQIRKKEKNNEAIHCLFLFIRNKNDSVDTIAISN